MKNLKILLIVILISVPTFFRMLPSGIHSMQDFHLFRLVEFDKCIKAFQIPCRWAPDAGLGYGEPLFNFYGQLSYAIGEIFHLTGISFIDSIKILFILSLIGSGISMFFLARSVWKNNKSAILSAVIYLYAPYRAVDVWVRGALPEALSFVLFPLVILSIERKKFFAFSFLLSALIMTHNLSTVMFLPVIVAWVVYRRFWKAIPAGILAFLFSAFYVLPAFFEAGYITLETTTQGYFDFRAHFLTIKQIFFDFSWGYGGSTWGPIDGLNLSVGLIQWVIPILIITLWLFDHLIYKKKTHLPVNYYLLLILGLFFLFLTHNKSTFIWETFTFMKYIQFPWRFLGVSVFCFSLASGAIVGLHINRFILIPIFALATCYMLLTTNYFRPDIWYPVSDSYFLTGVEWDRQRTASIGDFWPKFGHQIPDKPGNGDLINYFPGANYEPDKNGLISSRGAIFNDTPVRRIGNIISLATICATLLFLLF